MRFSTGCAIAAAFMIGGCAGTNVPSRQVVAAATILSAENSVTGNAVVAVQDGEIELQLEGMDLPPGVHGVHLHTTGRCVPPGFSSAGGHLDPFGRKHGTLNPQGPHLGDLPNLTIADNGMGRYVVPLRGSYADVMEKMFDDDGTAIVVHARADDYRTDPSGDSGGRIGCGVFARVG